MNRVVTQNYINALTVITFFLFICTFSTKIFAAEYAEDSYNKGLINEKYKEQSKFICNKQEFKILPYFPFVDKSSAVNLYLTAQENECNLDHFRVVLGLSSNCIGQNVCVDSIFEYRNFGKVESGYIEEMLSAYKADVDLSNNMKGYFIPSRCNSYCNPAKLIWFDYDKQKIYIISTKNDNSTKTINELVKSANSYINSQK